MKGDTLELAPERGFQAKRTARVKLHGLEYTQNVWELVGHLTGCESSGRKLAKQITKHIKHF